MSMWEVLVKEGSWGGRDWFVAHACAALSSLFVYAIGTVPDVIVGGREAAPRCWGTMCGVCVVLVGWCHTYLTLYKWVSLVYLLNLFF